jgi:hypothetical protein
VNRMAKAALLTRLLIALRNHGSWCGETHVQKSIYLLQELCAVPLDFRFVLYKHGPFSFDLRDELTSLQADDLLALQPQAIPYGPRLAPTVGAQALANRFPKTLASYGAAVDFIAERLGSCGVNALERLATAVYVRRQHPEASSTECAKILVGLKPHILLENALTAVDEADQLFLRPGCSPCFHSSQAERGNEMVPCG